MAVKAEEEKLAAENLLKQLASRYEEKLFVLEQDQVVLDRADQDKDLAVKILAEKREREQFLQSQLAHARQQMEVAEHERIKAESLAKETLENDRGIIQKLEFDKAKLLQTEQDRIKAEKSTLSQRDHRHNFDLEILAQTLEKIKQDRLKADDLARQKLEKFNLISEKLSRLQLSTACGNIQEEVGNVQDVSNILEEDKQLLEKAEEDRLKARRNAIEKEGDLIKVADQVEFDRIALENAQKDRLKSEKALVVEAERIASAAETLGNDKDLLAKSERNHSTAEEILEKKRGEEKISKERLEKDKERLVLVEEKIIKSHEMSSDVIERGIQPEQLENGKKALHLAEHDLIKVEDKIEQLAEKRNDSANLREQDEKDFNAVDQSERKIEGLVKKLNENDRLALQKAEEDRLEAENPIFQRSELERLARENMDRDIDGLEVAEQEKLGEAFDKHHGRADVVDNHLKGTDLTKPVEFNGQDIVPVSRPSRTVPSVQTGVGNPAYKAEIVPIPNRVLTPTADNAEVERTDESAKDSRGNEVIVVPSAKPALTDEQKAKEEKRMHRRCRQMCSIL